jgi:quinol monooxygenase YgiN
MAATLFVRHKVADYDAWRTVYDSVETLRSEFGCIDAEVSTDPSDRNDVFVVHRFPTLDQAQGFAASGELQVAMGRAGVAGPPRIEIVLGA